MAPDADAVEPVQKLKLNFTHGASCIELVE